MGRRSGAGDSRECGARWPSTRSAAFVPRCPFSRWLLARPEFAEARFHTGFLDELLQQRAGEPFGEPDSSLEEVAAIAACLAQASVPAFAEGAAPRAGPGRRSKGRQSLSARRRGVRRAELEGSGTAGEPARVKFEVETGRRRRTIEIRRSGNGWTVTVDGRPMSVDLARVGDRWSMLVRRGDLDAGAEHSTDSNAATRSQSRHRDRAAAAGPASRAR